MNCVSLTTSFWWLHQSWSQSREKPTPPPRTWLWLGNCLRHCADGIAHEPCGLLVGDCRGDSSAGCGCGRVEAQTSDANTTRAVYKTTVPSQHILSPRRNALSVSFWRALIVSTRHSAVVTARTSAATTTSSPPATKHFSQTTGMQSARLLHSTGWEQVHLQVQMLQEIRQKPGASPMTSLQNVVTRESPEQWSGWNAFFSGRSRCAEHRLVPTASAASCTAEWNFSQLRQQKS